MNPIPTEPVHLIEDAETGDHILIYGTEKGTRLELRYEGETLWMNQPQIAELFGVSRQSVNSHLINIYEDGSLIEKQPARKSCRFVTKADGRLIGKP
jgi:hypothetical protein